VWARIVLVVVVALGTGLVLYMNRANRVAFWFFGLTSGEMNVLWLILWTAGATLLVWWVATLLWGLLADLRELRRVDALQLEKDELQRREAALAERERRVDEKTSRAISGSGESVP